MMKAVAGICLLIGVVVFIGTTFRRAKTEFPHNEDSALAKGQMKFAFDQDRHPDVRVDAAESREHAPGDDPAGQCVGVLRITDFNGAKLLMLYDQDNNDCSIGETPANRKTVLDACQTGRWCAVVGKTTPQEGDPKHLHVGVDNVFLAIDLRNRLPRQEERRQPPPKPVETAQPNLKVSWYAQPTKSISGHKPALDNEYYVKIQSADDAPVVLKEMIVNERNNCVVLTGGTPKMVFGDVFTAALNPFVQGCTDVLRVRLVTDRGEITYNFK
jgi:hypothetical protein